MCRSRPLRSSFGGRCSKSKHRIELDNYNTFGLTLLRYPEILGHWQTHARAGPFRGPHSMHLPERNSCRPIAYGNMMSVSWQALTNIDLHHCAPEFFRSGSSLSVPSSFQTIHVSDLKLPRAGGFGAHDRILAAASIPRSFTEIQTTTRETLACIRTPVINGLRFRY